MKFEYEKPQLEEHDLLIEGSFLDNQTGVTVDPSGPGEGGDGNTDIWG
ncbi:hypothetical protein HDR58_00455 [bacterium]|nr:hypothetical protein [bacterium]